MRICQCLRAKRKINNHPTTPYTANTCDEYWTWDEVVHNQSSVQTYGRQGRTVLFHSEWSNGTVAIRADRPLPGQGIHYWEIDVSHRVFGTSLMFGVGTDLASLHDVCFVNIIGQDDQSWGLNHKGYTWHNGRSTKFTEPFKEYTPTTVGLLYNAADGTLSYFKDGQVLGVAFKNLNRAQRPLYPMISSTAARTEMTLSVTRRSLLDLQDRCCWRIVQCLKCHEDVDQLPLPVTLRKKIVEQFKWSTA